MLFNNKPLDAIVESDLQELITNQVAEGKMLDYKADLPDETYEKKKEFLADVTSFSNASGGHLILGIPEEAGIPTDLKGLSISDADALKNKLENIIRDGIEPRILGIIIQPIPLHTGNTIIIISIPRSWNAPHVAKLQSHWRFYSRNSAGKYPLDVGELRAAFALSESVAERIRNFRAERLSKIVAGETPIALANVPKMILHSIPFGAFDPTVKYDLSTLMSDPQYRNRLGPEQHYTFEGLMGFSRNREIGPANQYTQIFRHGIVEFVDADMLDGRNTEDNRPILPSQAFEEELIDAVQRAIAIQQHLGIEMPLVIMVSLLGVRGYVLTSERLFMLNRIPTIDQNDLLVPEELVDNFDCKASQILRPVFDAIWNSAGWKGSPNYDPDGNRISRR